MKTDTSNTRNQSKERRRRKKARNKEIIIGCTEMSCEPLNPQGELKVYSQTALHYIATGEIKK